MPLGAAVGAVFVEIGSNFDGSGFDQADDRMKSTNDRLMSMGKGMESVGRSMSRNLTLPIIAGFALAARETINFESAMAGVAKTIDLTDSEFEAMSQGIRDMAKELPATREEIAAVAEAAGQLGISKDNILAFTRTMIDLGESTNLTADEAATSMAQLANITQMPQTEFAALADTLVALGNAGASTEADILELGQRLAASGSQAGLTEAQILGLASAMADVGINAEMGGTSMSQVLNKMRDAAIEGGESLEAFAETAGMTADQFARLFQESPEEAITAFVEGLARISEEGGTMTPVMEGIGLSGERVRDTLSRLAGAGDGVAESFARATEEFGGGALMEEAARRYETTGAQMEMAWNQITDAAMELGDVLVPVLSKVVGNAAGFAQAFAGLPGPVMDFVVALGSLIAIAGPLLFAGGKAVQVWARFGEMAPGAQAAIAGMARSLGTMVSGLIAANPAIAAAVIAVGALAAAIVILESGSYGHSASSAVEDITDTLMEASRAAGSAEAGLAAFLTQNIDPAVARQLADIGVSIEDMVAAITGGEAGFNRFIQMLSDAGIDPVMLEILREVFPGIADGMNALGQVGALDGPAELLGGITDEATAAEEAVQDLETAWAGLNNLLSDTGAQVAARQALRDLQETAISALEDGINAAETDDITQSTLDYASALQDAAEAANTAADGTVNARGAQRDLLASMQYTRAFIPAQMIPMWDRMIATLETPADLEVNNRQALADIDTTTAHGRRQWVRTFVAQLEAINRQALNAIAEAQRRAEAFAAASYTAHINIVTSGGFNTPGMGVDQIFESSARGSSGRASVGASLTAIQTPGGVAVVDGGGVSQSNAGEMARSQRPVQVSVEIDGEVIGRTAALYLDPVWDR